MTLKPQVVLLLSPDKKVILLYADVPVKTSQMDPEWSLEKYDEIVTTFLVKNFFIPLCDIADGVWSRKSLPVSNPSIIKMNLTSDEGESESDASAKLDKAPPDTAPHSDEDDSDVTIVYDDEGDPKKISGKAGKATPETNKRRHQPDPDGSPPPGSDDDPLTPTEGCRKRSKGKHLRSEFEENKFICKVDECEQQRQLLKKQLAVLKEHHQTECAKYQQQLADSITEPQRSPRTFQKLQVQITKLEQEIDSGHVSLTSAKSEVANLTFEVKTMKAAAKLVKPVAQPVAAGKELKMKKKELTRCGAKLNQAVKSRDDLKERFRMLEEDLSASTDLAEILQTKLDSLEDASKTAATSLVLLGKSHENNVTLLTTEVKDLKATSSGLKTRLTELQASVKDMENQKNAAVTDMSRMQEQLTSALSDSATTQVSLKRKSTELQISTDKLSHVEAERDKKANSLKKAVGRKKELASMTLELGNKTREFDATRISLRSLTKTSTRELEESKGKVATLQDTVATLKVEVARYKGKNKKNKQENSQTKSNESNNPPYNP
jgi:chromosome segregation ATPase